MIHDKAEVQVRCCYCNDEATTMIKDKDNMVLVCDVCSDQPGPESEYEYLLDGNNTHDEQHVLTVCVHCNEPIDSYTSMPEAGGYACDECYGTPKELKL